MSTLVTKEPPPVAADDGSEAAGVNLNRRNFHPSPAGRQALPIGGAR
jgi:hypothetical protein